MRSQLFNQLGNAEKNTDLLITELMAHNTRYSDPSKVMEVLEAERAEMETLFTINQQDVEKLKEQEVKRSMQRQMEEEMARAGVRRQYEQRQGIVQEALNSTLENDRAVEAVLTSNGQRQEDLLGQLLEDEMYQRKAFQSLLVQQDGRSQEISDQMERIQNELASLTMVEMKKRDMKVEFELEVLKEKRETLTNLLLDLLQKKKQRAEDLQELLGELEAGKEEDMENYWLIQYQKLLNTKPQSVLAAESKLDHKVRSILDGVGGDRLIPLFAKRRVTFKQLSYADHAALQKLGVESEYLRNEIMTAVEALLAAESGTRSAEPSAPDQNLDDAAASAPPPDSDALSVPSAPSAHSSQIIETFISGECVVCLERKSEIIFLPCGHLCTCLQCEEDMEHCPLCRNPILQRVRLGV